MEEVSMEGPATEGALIARCIKEWEIDVVVEWHLLNSQPFLAQIIAAIEKQFALPFPTESARLQDVFLHKATGTGPANGENDIRCVVQCGECTLILLVETKIGAPFTERQPERYRMRCDQHSDAKTNTSCFCVLLAPSAYFHSPRAELFHARLSLQELDEIVKAMPVVPAFADIHREHIALVGAACYQQYAQSRDPIVGEFWDDYRRFAALRYPEMQIKTRVGASRWSKDVYFRERLPRWQVKHRLDVSESLAVIELLGWGAMLDKVIEKVSPFALASMIIGAPPKGRSKDGAPRSVHISMKVPPIDTLSPFNEQVDAVATGLDAIALLLNWCDDHSSEIRRLTAEFDRR